MAVAAALALAACDGGVTEVPFLAGTETPGRTPTPTASPTATPSPTPSVSPAELQSFRGFAREVEDSIAETDPTFILQNTLISEYECRGLELELENCYDVPAGTTVSGVYSALMNSDFVELTSPNEVAEHLRDFIGAASAAEADAYDSGEARLRALTWTAPAPLDRPFFVPSFGPLPGKNVFQAVLTSIPGDSPGPPGHPWRSCLVYRFFLEDDRWRLFEEVYGYCEADWLSGDCDFCYDYWERWEGAAP